MSEKSGILGEMEVARSVPLRLLQRMAADVHIDIDGPFATELNAALAQHAQADKPSHGYMTLDLAKASELLGDPNALMRLAYAGGRFALLPWRCDADRFVTVAPGEHLTALATDGRDTWGWCISEDGTCTVDVHSFFPKPVEAEVSFRLVQPNDSDRQIALDGWLLTSDDGYVRFNRQLEPGRTRMCFTLLNDATPIQHGGKPFHYAIFNLKVLAQGRVSQGFRLDAQLHGEALPERRPDARKPDEISIRYALHAAGFQYVTWAALTRRSAAVEMAAWSRGILLEPGPFDLDDRVHYGGSIVMAGQIYWFLGVFSAADRARWAA